MCPDAVALSETEETQVKTMFANSLKTLRLLPKAALITVLLAAPVMAVPAVRGDIGMSTIDAPALKKKGAGLVILVSLQRA